VKDRSAQVFMLALAALTTEVVLHYASLGDYPLDAGPAVDALAAGHPIAALRAQPLMGVVSIVLRAPFVAAVRAAGRGDVDAYRAGAIVCLLPAAWLAVRLVTSLGARPAQRSARLVAAFLLVASPAAIAAIQFGHPEEVLAASLVVGAVMLAARSRGIAAGIALGLAVATKQWALIAIAPTIAAAPREQRARLAGIAAATATLCFAPVLAVDPAGFIRMNHAAAGTHAVVTRTTIWFLAAAAHVTRLHLPPGYPAAITVYNVPAWVGIVAHPLLVLVPVPIVALLARARRRPEPLELVGVLALVCLLRCVLDPVDNLYYHVPLLLSLIAWEVVARVRLPVVSVLTAAALWATFELVDPAARPEVTNAFYLAWTGMLAVYLVLSVVAGPRRSPSPSTVQVATIAPAVADA
jgi:hypothetical protein